MAGAGLFFLVPTVGRAGPGRLWAVVLFFDACGGVQQGVAHEVGEALLAGFGGGDEAAFVAGGNADRDLGGFAVVAGFSDPWVLCDCQIGCVISVLHERSHVRVSAPAARCA